MRLLPLAFVLCLTLLFGGTNGPALAAGSSCSEDIRKFCTEIEPGGGRLVTCLNSHEQELSGDCRNHQEALKWKTRKAFPECKDDVERFCMTVSDADRHIIRCLLQNSAQLSGECRSRLNAGK